MQLDCGDFTRIVRAAATLDERLADACVLRDRGGANDAQVLVSRWRERVSGADSFAFRRRLRADGWTVARVRAALNAEPAQADDPLPTWACLVAEAVERFSTAPATERISASLDRPVTPDAPLPFEHVLLPFVAVARERIDRSPRVRLLTAAARADLERALLRRLEAHCGQALTVELDAFAAIAGIDADEAEDAFIADLRDGGLARLFVRLPVLARLVGTRMENWIDAISELLGRLRMDRDLLRRTFADRRAMGRVRAVKADLSDPHRGGRTVCVLRFQSGLRVVYKPRPLAVDSAWQNLLRWLNDRRAGPALRPLTVLDRGDYGWVEHAAAAPCRTAGEAARFHERSGALLCLAYALGGSDFHAANVIGCGAHPVLVDLEMLFGTAEDDAHGGAPAAHRRSVLHTGLLPQWVTGPGGRSRRQGGLVEPGPVFGKTIPRDPRSSFDADVPAPSRSDRPPENPRRVAAGFTAMYRALLRLRGELAAPNGPLAVFGGAEVRVLRRATWVYDMLLRRVRHPAYLASGADHGIELDTLCRPWLVAKAPAGGWAALRAERAALAAGDIPIFTTRATFTDAARRLAPLCDADLRVQRRLIRLAYADRAPTRAPAAVTSGAGERWNAPASLAAASIIGPRPSPVWARTEDEDDTSSPIDFADEALAIAEGLLRTAIRRPGGEITWIGPDARRGHSAFAPIGPALAHGTAGTALFLAACAAIDGGSRYRTAALRALRPLLRALREPGRATNVVAEIGIGGAAGLGGIVYALARTGGLLGDDRLLSAASAAAGAIDPAKALSDREMDVYSGTAGAVLGLLALHHATGASDALERAAEIGRRLAPAAATMRGRGFAHGRPGVTHALVRLHRATGDAEFRSAAALAFATPEPRLQRGVSPVAWCSGAAGVALARAAALNIFAEPAHQTTLDEAINAVANAPLQALDHPCCGNAGLIESLLVAADRIAVPISRDARHKDAAMETHPPRVGVSPASVRASALDRATRMVRRARIRHTYATAIEDRYTPGFLQGAAGIGYTLLRIADPHLPCVLLWE